MPWNSVIHRRYAFSHLASLLLCQPTETLPYQFLHNDSALWVTVVKQKHPHYIAGSFNSIFPQRFCWRNWCQTTDSNFPQLPSNTHWALDNAHFSIFLSTAPLERTLCAFRAAQWRMISKALTWSHWDLDVFKMTLLCSKDSRLPQLL